MNSQKILPIVKPKVSAYVEYAHAFSILGVYEESKSYQNWAVQQINSLHFIQDPVNKDNCLLTYFSSFNNSYIKDIPLFDIKNINTSTSITYQYKFEEILVSHLQEGFYIIISLDRYYIPTAPEYNNMHFIHQALIYGYDVENKTFNVADMYKENKYSCVTINIENLYMAYCDIDSVTTIKNKCFVVRYNDNVHVDFCSSIITTQLLSYIDKNSSITTANIYEQLYQRIDIQKCTDYGIYQVLYEHKQYLYYKVLILNKFFGIDFKVNNLEAFAKLVKQALSVRNAYLRASMIGLNSIEEKVRFKNELTALHGNDIHCHKIFVSELTK